MEIDFIPNRSLEQMKQIYRTLPQESVMIHNNITGLFVRLRHDPVCKYPRDKTHPSFCPFTTVLFFQKNEVIIKIANDGDHLTDGELLSVARSIPD
ncbi:MAG: hypothetical protein AAB664_00545 [Patescibacteria group bacterium]